MTTSLPPAQDLSKPAARPARLSIGQIVVLALIFVLGGFFRFYNIAGPSLWMDEIWSIEISTGRGSPHDHLPVGVIQTDQLPMTTLADAPPWWNVWTHMKGVTHPPLYHVVLRWWMDLFGNSAAATRSLSAVLSLLAVFALFDTCRVLHGNSAAILAAALMAVAGAQIEFAQETRSYPMLILLGLCCADALVRIEKFGATGRRLFCLAISLVAMALTHYFAAWGILVLAIYAVMRLVGRDRIRTAGAFVAGGLLAAILWGPLFIAQLHSLPSFSPDFLVESGAGHWWATFCRVIDLPAVYLYGQAAAMRIPQAALAFVTVLLVFAVAFQVEKRRDLLFWLLWLGVIVGGIALVDLAHGSAYAKYVRYSMLASPAVYALLAVSANGSSRPLLRNPLALVLLLLAFFLTVQHAADGAPSKEDWRHYAAMLDSSAKNDELLVFYNDSPWITPGMWYMNFKYYVPNSQRPWLILNQPADVALLQKLADRSSLVLIGNFPQRDGATVLPGWQPDMDEMREPTVGGICRMTHP